MTTATPTNPGWRIQLAIHRAVRRDARRLAGAVVDNHETSDAVREYWAVTAAQLHHHHEFEDTVVWPLLGQRLGDRAAALLARNAHEHQVMASAMDEFGTALAAADVASAGVALIAMQQAIEGHLAHEEADVLPLIPEAFTMDDIAFFQAEDAKTNTPAAFLPWILDDAPEDDFRFFTGAMPAPVRDKLESGWMPQRRRTIDALSRSAPVVSAS